MDGDTPLHYAARYQEEALLPVITSLLRAGADPGSSERSMGDWGLTPLHRALLNPAVTPPAIQALLGVCLVEKMGGQEFHPDAETLTMEATIDHREVRLRVNTIVFSHHDVRKSSYGTGS